MVTPTLITRRRQIIYRIITLLGPIRELRLQGNQLALKSEERQTRRNEETRRQDRNEELASLGQNGGGRNNGYHINW